MKPESSQLHQVEQLSDELLLIGARSLPSDFFPLRAGPLTMLFDPQTAFLRRIRLGPKEILRGVYAAVRDRNWGTITPKISQLQSDVTSQSFHVTFIAECRQNEINFCWRGQISGTRSGTVNFSFDGEALTTFWRNRIGLCVLHPIRECAGVLARQWRIDGTTIESPFPKNIEPQVVGQATFHDLRGLAHQIAPGLWAELQFEGAVFEMEDQRNWTDASFKTYCTPLSLPFPVEVPAGTQIRQSLILRLSGAPATSTEPLEITQPLEDTVTITPPIQGACRFPKIGLALPDTPPSLTQTQLARLCALRLAHLRFDLRLAASDWPSALHKAACQAADLGAELELALHLPVDRPIDLEALQRLLSKTPARLARVLALRQREATTSPNTLLQVRHALSSLDVPIGAGSDANFCELNHDQALGRVPLREADFVFWSVNPQVHAFDLLSVTETLEAQPDTLRTAREFAPDKPLVISPVTLKPRFNPVATTEPLAHEQPPSSVDPRQLSLFAAAWTLATVASLSNAGASSLTSYETTGPRGVMEPQSESSDPKSFPPIPGAVFPLYHVFAEFADATMFTSIHTEPQAQLAALTLFSPQGHRRVLLGNLAPRTRRIRIIGEHSIQVRHLDLRNVRAAMSDPEVFRAGRGELALAHEATAEIALPSFALACVHLDPC